jgi:hypothetical protein
MKFGPTTQGLAFAGALCVLALAMPDVHKGIDNVFSDFNAMFVGEQIGPNASRDVLEGVNAEYAAIMVQLEQVVARLERMETRQRATDTVGNAVYQQALDETCTVNGHVATVTTPEADRRMCKTVAGGFRAVARRDGGMAFYRVTQDDLAVDLNPFVVESDDHYFDIDAVKKAFKV